MREQNGEGFEGVSSNADLLLMDNSEDEEEEGESGFNDIRMIFDDDTDEDEAEGGEDDGVGEEEGGGDEAGEEEEREGNSSKSFEEERVELRNKPEDSINENNPNMQRYDMYAMLPIIHTYTLLWIWNCYWN